MPIKRAEDEPLSEQEVGVALGDDPLFGLRAEAKEFDFNPLFSLVGAVLFSKGTVKSLKKFLEENKILLDVPNERGFTVLHRVVGFKNPGVSNHHRLNVLKALIDAGANVNKKDSNGNTPLHYAAVRIASLAGEPALVIGYALEIFDLLKNAGANPELENDEGQTAEAIYRGAFQK